jgi:hypothetical protein
MDAEQTFSFSNLLGPLATGTLLNVLLYGICVAQYFEYYTAGFTDHWALRLVIESCTNICG